MLVLIELLNIVTLVLTSYLGVLGTSAIVRRLQWGSMRANLVDIPSLVAGFAAALLLVAYGRELLSAIVGGNKFEQAALVNRATGPFAWYYWAFGGRAHLPRRFLVPPVRRSARLVTGVPWATRSVLV